MGIKKVSAKHSRKADRRRSERLRAKGEAGPRKVAHPSQRRASRRRMDEGDNPRPGSFRTNPAWL